MGSEFTLVVVKAKFDAVVSHLVDAALDWDRELEGGFVSIWQLGKLCVATIDPRDPRANDELEYSRDLHEAIAQVLARKTRARTWVLDVDEPFDLRTYAAAFGPTGTRRWELESEDDEIAIPVQRFKKDTGWPASAKFNRFFTEVKLGKTTFELVLQPSSALRKRWAREAKKQDLLDATRATEAGLMLAQGSEEVQVADASPTTVFARLSAVAPRTTSAPATPPPPKPGRLEIARQLSGVVCSPTAACAIGYGGAVVLKGKRRNRSALEAAIDDAWMSETDIVIVSESAGGVFLSTDAGLTWDKVLNGRYTTVARHRDDSWWFGGSGGVGIDRYGPDGKRRYLYAPAVRKLVSIGDDMLIVGPRPQLIRHDGESTQVQGIPDNEIPRDALVLPSGKVLLFGEHATWASTDGAVTFEPTTLPASCGGVAIGNRALMLGSGLLQQTLVLTDANANDAAPWYESKADMTGIAAAGDSLWVSQRDGILLEFRAK